MFKGLKAATAAAGFSLLTAFGSVAGADARGRERHLNPEEIAIAQALFGNRMDYASVLIRQDNHRRSRAFGGIIRMSPDMYSNDYSKAPLPQRMTYIHEMMHILQEQHGVDIVGSAIGLFLRHGGNYNRAYDYNIDRIERFNLLNIEQQGALVEDYYFLRETTDRTNRVYNCDEIADYERVLRPVFPQIETPAICR